MPKYLPKKLSQIIVCLIAISYLLFSSFLSVYAQSPREWECEPNNCSIPNQNAPRAKGYEISDFEKTEKKIEKYDAQEPKQFKRYGKQNKKELGLDKARRGQFGAWSFPTVSN